MTKTFADFIISKTGYIIQKHYIDYIYLDANPTNLAEPIKQYNKIDTVYKSAKSKRKFIEAFLLVTCLICFRKDFIMQLCIILWD